MHKRRFALSKIIIRFIVLWACAVFIALPGVIAYSQTGELISNSAGVRPNDGFQEIILNEYEIQTLLKGLSLEKDISSEIVIEELPGELLEKTTTNQEEMATMFKGALINETNKHRSVIVYQTDTNTPVFKTDINPGEYVTLELQEGNFRVEWYLNGKLLISAKPFSVSSNHLIKIYKDQKFAWGQKVISLF